MMLIGCSGSSRDSLKDADLAIEVVEGDLGHRLDDFLGRCEKFGFSGSVLVARDGEILLHKGYGSAIRQDGIPNTVDTIHPVESITKPFTAIAILMLEADGRLSVEDRIGDWFEDAPPEKADLTLAQLLSHTSGFPGEYEPSVDVFDRDAIAREILGLDLEVEPGVEWHYSNPGFTLLAVIVELASGDRYDRFVKTRILEPSSMSSSGFLGGDRAFDRNRVSHPYNREIDGGSPLDWTGGYGGDWGAGGLLSTTGDLYRWLLALDRGLLLTQPVKEKMFAPRVAVFEDWSYGYGIFWATTERDTHFIRHGGNRSPAGVTAELRQYVDEDVTMILLVNSMIDEVGLTRAVRSDLLALLFGGDVDWPPSMSAIDPESLDALTGVYEIGSDTLELALENGALEARASSQKLFNLLKGHSPAEIEHLESILEASSKPSSCAQIVGESEVPAICHIGLAESFPGGLGTVYVEIEDSQGEHLERWIWEEDEYIYSLPSRKGPAVILQAENPRELVTWDLLRKKATRLLLSPSEDGSMAIEILGVEGDTVGRRVEEP